VATLKVSACDRSSQVFNQAHANQMIDMSGAVKPESPATGLCRWGGIMTLASKLPVRAAETEIPARSPQPRNQRCPKRARSTSIAAVVRFARLCVLIEPNPARRSVHRDLGRISIFIDTVRRAFLLSRPDPACLVVAIEPAPLKMLYVLTNFALVVRKIPAFPKRVLPCNRAPGPLDRSTLVYKPAHAYVHYHAQRQEGKQHRGSAVTH